MRKQTLLCLLLLNVLFAKSQQINQYQYWFDADYSTLQTISIAPVQDYYLNTPINVDVLSNGIHSINMRFKATDDKWSGITSDYFYKTTGTLSNAEYQYWIDNDFDNAVTVNINPRAIDYNLLTNINASALTNGYHNFNIRFRPIGGMWSAATTESFLKRGSDNTANFYIKRVKYWFDGDWQNAQQIARAAILSDSISAKVDGENLLLGRHQICYQFMDNSGMWSGTSCDSFTRAPILYKEFIYPTITLQNGNSFTSGQSIIFNGEQFYPSGEVTYTIKKEDDPNFILTNEQVGNGASVGADMYGKIHFNWNTAIGLKTGYYKIIAKDLTTNSSTPPSNFYIKNTADIPVNQFIQITSPVVGNVFDLNIEITINWIDRLFLNPSYSNTANIIGNTALRIAKYKLEYNIDGGSWISCLTNNGVYTKNGFVDQTFSGQYGFTPTQIGTYKIRITDLINNTNIGVSDAFLVSNPSNINLKVDFVWDYSGNRPNTFSNSYMPLQPKGVAADGVSRIYIKLSKQNTNPKTILSAAITISDAIGTTGHTRLGKVMAANNISSYSTEANSTISLSANSSDVTDGSLWFWYVAPDDFTRNSNDNLFGEREVIAKFNVLYNDGSTEILDNIKINIIRPPLMLVHGLNSDMTAWNNISFHVTPTTGFKFKDVKSLFKGGIQLNNMYPGGSFKLNAGALLNYDTHGEQLYSPKPYNTLPQENSFQNVLFKARNDGYSVNRVDYVCHSMGGSMARTAINILGSEYKPVAVSNRVFYNYDSGFINKLITINTPHNGSPIADEINEWCGKNDTKYRTILSAVAFASPTQSFVDFKPSTDNIPLYTFTATNAIKDLQYNNGGIKFIQTNVKNHLIVGKAAESGNCTLTIYNNLPLWIKEIVGWKGALLPLVASYGACSLIESIGNAHNVSNFHTESDLVVPLNSELAGKSINDISVTPFYGFQYNHLQVTNQTDVGDKVLELLNTSIHSSIFASSIPANTTAGNAGDIYRIIDTNNSLAADSVIEHINKDKIVITFPITNDTCYIDSILTTTIKILDTNNLKKVELIFQNDFVTTFSKLDSQIYKFQIKPYLNSKEYLLARASYDSLGYTVTYIDTVKINVSSISNPTALKMFPQITYLNPGQNFMPILKVKYDNVYAFLNKMTDSIEVIIKDTNVVRLFAGNKSLIAKDTGSTYIIYKYRNLSDTMFVYIYTNTSTSIILPVKLISFESKIQNCNQTTLQWQTAQEQNNKGFAIEQSKNGIDFYTIGNVQAVGNSNTIQSYNYTTTGLGNGLHYFRLKQIDNDGKFEYSAIINVKINCGNSISIFPNPAKDKVYVSGTGSNFHLKITNAVGATIVNNSNYTATEIDISNLAKGLYILSLDDKVFKVVKE